MTSCLDLPIQPQTKLPIKLVAAGLLVDSDGRILLQQRAKKNSDHFEGFWEFPGGKVMENETPESALIRELKEELAIDSKESCLTPLTFASHAYDDFHLLMPLYVLRQWRGVISPNHREVAAIKWLSLSAIVPDELLPADRPLLPLIRDLL